MSEESKKRKSAFPRAEVVREQGVVKRRKGRPPMPEGVMTDVTLRVRTETLEEGARLVERAAAWPEFATSAPTRSGVLRLAMLIGLKMLEER